MRRDISVMVFKRPMHNYICRACHNSQDRCIVIKNCSGIFVRTCDTQATIQFNNKEDTIIMSTNGFCNIKEYNHGNCLTDEDCDNCTTKNDAIRLYKQNNNLL